MTGSIHLRYLKGIISDLKLKELEDNLATVGVRFNYPVFQAYILGLMTNATYE